MIVKRFQNSTVLWWRVALMLVVIAALVRVAFGVWNTLMPAPAGSASAPASAATQVNEGGQVTITATWQGDNQPVFKLAMDTHAVDLDGYDLAKLAVLRTDQGQTVQPTGWDAPKGGHHREGTLTFPTTAADGTPVLSANTRRIELLIRNVADVPERTLTWTR